MEGGGGDTEFTDSSILAATRPTVRSGAGGSRSPQPLNQSAKIVEKGKSSSETVHDSIFESVPSRAEVEKAIVVLDRFMRSVPASKSELKGLQGLLQHHDPKMLQASGLVKFRDAFSTMRSDPALQNTVASISCDKTVWDALMENKAVQDLRSSFSAAQEQKLLGSCEEPDILNQIMRWIMNFTKVKILELVGNFVLLLNDFFRSAPKEMPVSELTVLMEESVRSSLLLCVVILMIVIAMRCQG